MSSKRVFSNKNLTIDYKDYIKYRNGCEILKTIKIEDSNATLNQFKSYNKWQAINTAYFKYIDNDNDINYLTNLYSANESFINKSCITDLTICEQEKNILFPYGSVIQKKETIEYFPTKIYLNKWCIKKEIKDDFEKEKEQCSYPIINNCQKCNSKKPRKLFI